MCSPDRLLVLKMGQIKLFNPKESEEESVIPSSVEQGIKNDPEEYTFRISNPAAHVSYNHYILFSLYSTFQVSEIKLLGSVLTTMKRT